MKDRILDIYIEFLIYFLSGSRIIIGAKGIC